MADSEWFIIDPDRDGTPQHPNLESADRAAREQARRGSEVVAIVRCTSTVVRRYRRQVTVTAEDVSAATYDDRVALDPASSPGPLPGAAP